MVGEQKYTGPNAEAVARSILDRSDTCTLATASSDGCPEAATIFFKADGTYNIYFNTFPEYRKYRNLQENPRAAVVVTQDEQSVQLEGHVEKLGREASARILYSIVKENGEPTGYLADPSSSFFKLEPDWIRVLVDSSYPPDYRMIMGEGPVGYHRDEEKK